MEILRKYGEATTILFPLIDAGAADFESSPVTFAAGDTQISKDEGAFANTGSNPAHEGNGMYSLALTATEMQAARIMITVIDQTATKEWEDRALVLSTYGNAAGQHAFDLDTATQNVTATTVSDKTGYSISGTKTTLDALNDFDPAVDAVATVTAVTNDVNADVLRVNGNSDAASGLRDLGVAYDLNAYVDSNDAAIADAVWDEATADHTASGSFGKAVADAGIVAGAVEVSDILIDDGTDPLEGAEVWLSTDGGGTNIIWYGTTNASGNPKDSSDRNPFLDTGTYYLWVQLSGYSFSNPTTEVVV
jgi:hypothetical protein